MSKKVAIIIVNWNGEKFLKACLEAIRVQSYKNYDVYIVDNDSKDNSVDFIKKNYPETKLLQLDYNSGFTGGNNAGMREALKDNDVEYIVLVNNDTIVGKDWLQELVNCVDYNKKYDMGSSAAYFTDGNIQSVGLLETKDLIGNKIGGLSVGYGESPDKYKEPFEVYAPSGVAALYTRRLIEEVGMFDEEFFCYAEDLDLGIRARQKGYRCMFNPKSKLVHLHSQSSGGVASNFKVRHLQRNRYFVVIKNFGIIDIFLFPFREVWGYYKLFFGRKTSEDQSSEKLKYREGKFGLVKIYIQVFFETLIKSPKMLAKRFKDKKY